MPDYPKKIWQTWKQPFLSLETTEHENVQQWRDLNPEFEHHLLTDEDVAEYISANFKEFPVWQENFGQLQDNILRADLFRYMVLFMEGGVYSDIDTKVLKEVDNWIPSAFKSTSNIAIGIEMDQPEGKVWPGTSRFQLCQWTMMAKPKHWLLWSLIEGIFKRLRVLSEEQQVHISAVSLSSAQVINITGPAAVTAEVFRYLTHHLQRDVTGADMTRHAGPQLLHDVLILPVNAFGSGQPHSDSGEPSDDTALVQHLFKGIWKENHIHESI
ncbi:glycosyltransferase family 32 protein [Xylona heveae TC161]|uniref:Glycosyltransferase family 32 protein n=1 Tax=Xylona heveae (strain CBS 132557 / TC161) TaxID=1328760 RepID=A0A165H3K4_XYLHT|nr:glycosyltransferase family 32 protein [Xylona heveae TC161]KZF22936.1 glycosyltransferase family 32 protein [Xylona heveae TC161]